MSEISPFEQPDVSDSPIRISENPSGYFSPLGIGGWQSNSDTLPGHSAYQMLHEGTDRLKKIKNSSADPVKTKWVTEWEDRISRLEKLSLYINAMRNGIDQNKKMRQILPEVGDYEDSERDLKSSEELVRDLAHQINEELQDISKRLNEEKESISESDLERSGFINLMTRNWLKLQVIGKCPEVSMFKNRLVADMRYPKPSVKIPYEKLLDISVRAIFVVKHLPGASTVQVIEEHIAPPSLSPSPSPSSRVTPIQDFFDDCDYPELAELRSSRLARKSIYIPGKLKNVVRLALKRVERDVFGVGDSPVQVPAAVKPLYHFGAAIFQILGWTDRLTSEENESFSPTNV